MSQRTVLNETVYETIRQRLVNHDIEPGSKLTISALAASLEVSHTPVREALARLEADGLAVKRNLAGYTAAPLMTGADFEDLFEMRLLLEPAAAARAATRITTADLDTLDRLVEEMRTAEHDPDKDALRVFVRNDALFHERIAEAGGNSMMVDALRRLHAHTHLYRLYFQSGIAEATCREHDRIVSALRDGDPETAAATMRTHIRRAQDRLLSATTETD